MTKNGWCHRKYHADGKRRWGNLTNGLCSECSLSLTSKEADKITQCQEKINDLELERSELKTEIDRLHSKLQTLINSLGKSGVAK